MCSLCLELSKNSMTTSLSLEISKALRAFAAIPGFKLAPKFKTKQGMLYVGDFASIEFRVIQSAPSNEVSVFLEKLKSAVPFRVGIGRAIQAYGLVTKHETRMAAGLLKYYTLPDGLYTTEFASAFSGETAAKNLLALMAFEWPMVLTSQQVEIVIPLNATESGITSCLNAMLALVTQPPYQKDRRKVPG